MFASTRARPRRQAALVAAVLVILGEVTACTTDDGAAPPVRTVVEKVWTAAGIDPVSAVENIGGVAVGYAADAGGLMIYGIDPATGTQLWNRPAVTTVTADAVTMADIDGTVAYFRPTGTGRIAQLVLADPATGADLTVSSARYWFHTPHICDDDAGWVCLISLVQADSGSWDSRDFRVNRKSGETRPDNTSRRRAADVGFALPAADLYVKFHEDRFDITRRVNDSTMWIKRSTELFGATTTAMSSYHQSESADGTYTVLDITGATGDPTEQLDLATDLVTAAVNLSDGSSRWISPGSSLGCVGDHPMLDWQSDEGASAFRCRYTGTAVRTISALDGSQNATSNLGVTLERFDAATGAVTWVADVADARTLAGDPGSGASEAVLDDTRLFIPNSVGGLVVDLDTGETRPPTASEVLWCNDARTYARPEPYYPDDSKQVTTAHRKGVYRPCRADGSDAPLPTTTIPSEVSASFDPELRVVALTDGVAGFLVPPAGNDEATAGPAESSNISEAAESSAETTPATTESRSPASPTSALTAVEQVWSTTGFEPLTDVQLVGETAVLYGTIGSDLFVIGLDPHTGTERWRQRASAAGFSPTTKIRAVEIEGTIAYLRPTASMNQNSQLVLAEPTTGADRLVTEARWWTEFPVMCDDDSAFLCGWSYASKENLFSVTATRIERSTGTVTVVSSDSIVLAKPYDALQGDLVRVNGAPTDTVGVLRDGSLRWSAPVADLLGAPSSSKVSWLIGNRPGTPRLIYFSATVAWEFDNTTGYPTLDLATNQVTVGVNAETGTVLWREPGTRTNCRGLLGDIERMSTPGSPYPALRCRYAGQLTSSPPGGRDELAVPTNLSVTLERVDLSTGKAIWSVPLGAQASLAVDTPGLAMIHLDDHRILLTGQVVDLDTGAVRQPATDETFWCPARQTFRQSIAAQTRGGPRTDRTAGGAAYQCDADANPAAGPPTTVPLAVSTATDDGLRLVSTPAGVIAYRVPL